MRHPHMSSGGRYPVLRTIAILWLVTAVLSLVAGVYQAIVALTGSQAYQWVDISSGHWGGRVMACLIWLGGTFFAVIFNIAVAELIKLFIDIEHNSRMAAISAAANATGGTPTGVDNGIGGRLSEETAEGALIRGH